MHGSLDLHLLPLPSGTCSSHCLLKTREQKDSCRLYQFAQKGVLYAVVEYDSLQSWSAEVK
jgi:hypothetical protein